MDREFFLKTNRIGFSKWVQNDLELAKFFMNPYIKSNIGPSLNYQQI